MRNVLVWLLTAGSRFAAYRRDRVNGRPPWWVWFEPPGWWPGWAHSLGCTYCRGLRAYGRQVRHG